MGLDMYLTRKVYVKQWDRQHPSEKFEVTVTKGGIPFLNSSDGISNVSQEIGYWRKFNALHNWFVENVQDGRDECQEAYVSPSKLEELLNILNEVKDGDIIKAEELLPTTSGFFFGSTEYDEWYFENVNESIPIIEKALSYKEDSDIYYQSSW